MSEPVTLTNFNHTEFLVVTDAHSAAFQTVSADNHHVHWDAIWPFCHGHSAQVVHGLQVLAFSAPGTTLFSQYIGESFIDFTELSCKFLKEVYVTIYNLRNELILLGQHKYLLKS